jgi:hypothetical protein
MTAESNLFQVGSGASPEEQQDQAVREFDTLVAALRAENIDVVVVDDTSEPHTPDSIFPNNWVSFHADGRVVLYPMEAANRRTERRADIIEMLTDKHGFQVTEVVDLSGHEKAGHYLEGTGSMVLDRTNRVAYACLSSRTQLDPLGDFAQRMGYDVVAFDAVDRNGAPLYHSNVLMSVGETVAIICDAAIVRDDQREAVMAHLRESGHDVLRLNYDQLEAFAGNMLELRNREGDRVLAMSSQAWDSLSSEQQVILRANGKTVRSPINNIESSAGGSVRCMLAEIHLPN